MRANLVSRLVRADTRLGFHRARARDWQWLFSNEKIAARPHQHVMDGLFGFAEHLGIHERVLRWDFALSAADRRSLTDCVQGLDRSVSSVPARVSVSGTIVTGG